MNSRDAAGVAPLFFACCRDSVDIATMMLSKEGLDLDIDIQDDKGRTALSHSVVGPNANVKCVELLLSHGARVDISSADIGFTALMEAICSRNTECVKLLLEHGANPLKKNVGGSVMNVAETCGDRESTELVQAYINQVWHEGPPKLERLCAFKLKRMRHLIEDIPISKYVPDFLLDDYFEGWKR